GYVVLTATAPTRLPVATALFSYTNPSGVLVTEAAVGASEPIRSGRIFVDEGGAQTGFAIAKPATETAAATLILRADSGQEFARQSLVLDPQKQVARFVAELFPSRPANFTGSLTFESDRPLAAITLRQSTNAFGEPLYTTLPVLNLAASAGNQPLVFPHIAAGDGYTTLLALINPTATTLRGQVRLFGSDGSPLLLRLGGTGVTQFSYQIEANGTFSAALDNLAGLNTGYAQVIPDAGTLAPGGAAIFQFRKNGSLVTEAGVA